LLSILLQLENPSAIVGTEAQLLYECVYIMMVMGAVGYTRDMALFSRVCEWAYYWVPCISANGCRQLAVASCWFVTSSYGQPRSSLPPIHQHLIADDAHRHGYHIASHNARPLQMACAQDLTGVRLAKLYVQKKQREGIQQFENKGGITMLTVGVIFLLLAQVLAMVNYEGTSTMPFSKGVFP
jgi:hypothetical protein